MPAPKRNQGLYLIEGIAGIARAVGRSESTVKRWIARGFLPAGKLPDGTYFITEGLLDRMAIASHQNVQAKKLQRAMNRQLDLAS